MSVLNFASDNVTGCCPEIMAALQDAAQGSAIPYGNDAWTARAQDAIRDVFAKPDAVVLPVATGTAANALALAALCPPWGAVICHAEAHVHRDECGAPEMYTGGAKLVPLAGEAGKLTPDAIRAATPAAGGGRDVHRVQPAAVTLTQATEMGTVYSPEEVAAIAAVCRERGLHLHMDGARFANAVAGLGCAPADVTWKAGVDVLSFGASKNGAWAAEALVFFDPALAEGVEFRRKRAGHLLSKGRFLGAQLEAYVRDGLWLRNAAHANTMAARLAEGLSALPGVEPLFPVQANEVFLRLPAPLAEHLRDAGVVFAPWPDLGPEAARFVCSFATRQEEVAALLDHAATLDSTPSAP